MRTQVPYKKMRMDFIIQNLIHYMLMLAFFRKYQKIFFLFVTIIIVTSFVFFGTFQAISPSFKSKEVTAFKTAQGKTITVSYLNDMTHFLSKEPLTMRGFQNFLNDYVVTKDILDAQLGLLLMEEKGDKIEEEIQARQVKEKVFRPYCHPLKKELSAEKVWQYFAKPLHEAYKDYMKSGSLTREELFEKREHLFLMERRFPGDILTYILRNQEKQSPELGQDPRLYSESLALFGYKDLIDWFGPTYIENAAKTIIRVASYARDKGYKVSKEEIAADILLKSERWFQQVKQQTDHWPHAQALYYDCLKMLQIDEPRLMAIMEDILLFRRLFQDTTEFNCVDTFSLKNFFQKAHECIEVEYVTLPGEYSFKKADDLKKFEAYLECVSSQGRELLSLPETFDAVDVIEKRAKDLLSSGYVVEMAQVSKKECEAKVSLKETWKWEEDHMAECQKKFPDLVSLELLSSERRSELDAFARRQILEKHSTWISEILASKKLEEKKLIFPKTKLEGIHDVSLLAELLDQEMHLVNYTQDNEHYYTIKVKEKLKKELLTFKEAREFHILDKIVKTKKDSFYDSLFDAIYSYAKPLGLIDQYSQDKLAQLRFAYYVNEVKEHPEKEMTLWPLLKKKEEIYRYSKSHIDFEKAILKDQLPLIDLSDTLGLYFVRFIDHRIENSLPLERMLVEEKWISNEIKQKLLVHILQSEEPTDSQVNG